MNRYRILQEEEFLNLIDDQMKSTDCRCCHAKAMLGNWKTKLTKNKTKEKEGK